MSKAKKPTDQQSRFIDEYCKPGSFGERNATQAYRRAYPNCKSDHAAQVASSRLLLNVVIRESIDKRLAEISKKAMATAEYVLTRLKENVERAMQIEPVLNSQGDETGVYRYEGAVANKGLELLGKNLNLFTDRVEHTGKGGGKIETEATVTLIDARAKILGFADAFRESALQNLAEQAMQNGSTNGTHEEATEEESPEDHPADSP